MNNTDIGEIIKGAEYVLTSGKTAGTADAATDLEVLKSVPKDFFIDSEQSANWLIRKVVAARQYAERVKQWSVQEQNRAAREEQTLMFLFGRQLEAWVAAEIGKHIGKRKSLTLPGGSVGFRAVAAKLVIDDEIAVLHWAKANCEEAVVVVEKIAKSAINDHFAATGEIPDGGAHVEPQQERFFIK